MAQDFQAAFGYGGSSERIAIVDVQGVTLAAIQALSARNAKLEERNNELAKSLSVVRERQQQELSALREELALLRELVAPAAAMREQK
jgi:hypothetical protein